ncbi:substrate-binding domain-containing protein [Nostocoides jenkinsii]|jgi:fructose transport system substrate-binding protein|uniref:Sugar ABC transporter, periplasmic sugar-binding protein n=1 Tax=Nostocoides jenkinsii Ben 74 TaxID=1193518 RepID=A0A077M3A0_9MICO|nr:substrate-binding domain-containing protein [Tetrasphaera jenkinsii]CCI51691.1 Sugar ABC transporter, periplasmic sugar-binding protein [Tetrasphaera jenkinsii Ben 74]
MQFVRSSAAARRIVAASGACALALSLAACGGDSGSGDAASGGSGGGKKIGVTLITKDSTNPFFVAMQKGAQADAGKNNVELTIASGKQEGDDQGQIDAIEQAIARGDKGILITPMSDGVNAAIKKARDAGLYVIALDTPPDPADTVDITFATDNREAGKLIGQWAAGTLKGEKATIALLDLFNDKIVSVDYNRDQGFLEGMGIDVADGKKNGDEAPTGKYSGGDYEIVCNEPSNGAEDGGRTAMEKCLAKNSNINVVYTINEPAAVGANAALQAEGKKALIVSVDGGCAGVGSVKSGVIGATSQQYPLKMATLGMEAIAKIANGGAKPAVSEGLDFFNTGVALVTDKPVDGVSSITADEGAKICWGN